ncbi:MAG: 5-formyltetrahydrofolate cyclo-ligase [Clostridia bacterium]|nr:5-formyltetrahydrofolate cyclo-ligase [Clostridia bacterium]
MNPIKREKDAIRRECADRRNQMPMEEHAEFDKKIIDVVASLVSFKHADIVLLYAPIKSEIDVMPIFELAKEKGKRVAFPKCDTENRTMKFHFVDSLDDLEPCAYNIREPKEEAEIYDPKETKGSALCIVPGLAFDVYGYRLGYGKGYYDKFMNNFTGSTIGVAYTHQILPSLPKGKFDKHCDVLITEKGIKTLKIEK